MKKLSFLTAALIFALAVIAPVSALAEKADRTFEGGMFKLTTAEDFALGTLEAVKIDETVGNGALVLEEGAAKGTFTSDTIGVEPFEYLVASWNADVPKGTTVEVFVRAYVDMKKEWSSWISWGTWSDSIRRASGEDEDELAYIDTDTFTVKGQSGETASLVEMKVELTANEAGESPVVRQLAASYKNTLDGQPITPAYYGEAVELPASAILDTPAYSQGIRERSIAGEMCSATTATVLLNDRGEDALPEELALTDYDYFYEGFGNWSYTVAAIGAYGYDAYCQYADLETVKQELAHGYSVGLSVRYSNSTNGGNPYLEGAPISNTSGHLITITGYETVDGVDYFFSSDSAAASDEKCFVRYKGEQLDNAWAGKLAYMVHEKEDVSTLLPRRVEAELIPVEGSEAEYALTVNGEQIALSKSFSTGKLKADGCGIAMCYIEGDAHAAIPEGKKKTTANEFFRYVIKVTAEGNLQLKPESVLSGFDGALALVHVFVMVNDGTTYEAVLEMENPAVAAATEPAESAAPQATPEATAVPEATAAPVATEAATRIDGSERKPTSKYAWLIIAIVAIVAISAGFYVRSRLEKAEREKEEAKRKTKKK